MQHYWLDLLFFLVFDRKELSIQDSSLCMEFVPFALNLMGLLLQIEGVIIGGYAVRRLIFRKGNFGPHNFGSHNFGLGTKAENLPIDEKTNKPISEIATIDLGKAIFGVISIIGGLSFQVVALFF